jgi:hypothetical protein
MLAFMLLCDAGLGPALTQLTDPGHSPLQQAKPLGMALQELGHSAYSAYTDFTQLSLSPQARHTHPRGNMRMPLTRRLAVGACASA